MKGIWLQKFSAHKRDLVIALTIFGVTLLTFLWSPIHLVSDSKYMLVVSQSLLSHRSFALDHFALPKHEPKDDGVFVLNGKIPQLEYVGDHLYYIFPPGSSVLSLPAVALMNRFGLSVINADGTHNVENEVKQQTILAAILMALLAVIFYATSRLLLPARWALIVALGATLGTQVWSTLSRGVWSDTWGVLLLAIVVWQLMAARFRNSALRPILLGTLLAWAYFVRPTNAVPLVAVAAYVLIYYRRNFLSFAAAACAWIFLFVVYSWAHFHKLLPSYYTAKRLTFENFGEGLAGNLISPSRGLFVFVPVTLFVFYLLVRHRRKLGSSGLAHLSLGIVVTHWIAISGYPQWWGGGSYGPRLMAGVLPWLVLLAIISLDAMLKTRAEFKDRLRTQFRLANTVGALLLLISVFLNGIGAIMPATVIWNYKPTRVDRPTTRLWDWRYPQFLAGFLRPPLPAVLPPANVRVQVGRNGAKPYLLDGWSVAEEIFRWTDGREATVIFHLDEVTDAELRMQMAPFLVPGKLERQRVGLKLNQHSLGTITLTDHVQREYSWKLPKENLQKDNVLRFELPDATTPKAVGLNEDLRELALAVSWLEIKTANYSQLINAKTRTVAEGPLPEGGYDAAIEPINPPGELKIGESAVLTVKVKNTSGAVWYAGGHAGGRYTIRLGNHWLDSNSRRVVLNDGRVMLPYDLRPYAEVELLLPIKAPAVPGTYVLELDMVQEGQNWFADEESRTARITMIIR
ncbi:MAG TPA: hypothetical protein VIT19_07475 [Pyrinomonadaceae bacterium]